MGSIGKVFSLTLILILAVSCLMMVKTACASIPKPSVPEFTLKFVDHSYDVPPTYGIDPYTGKNVTTQAGYHVENKSIEVSIKNQPFTPYKNANGNTVILSYNIRWKGHYADYWTNLSYNIGEYNLVASNSLLADNVLVYPNAPFTEFSYAIGENPQFTHSIGNVSAGGQVDFQVDALIGYITRIDSTPVPPFSELYHYVFIGEESGWSNTQTITIPDTSTSASASPNPTPTSTPTVPEFPSLAILPLFVLLLSIAVLFRLRKQGIKTCGLLGRGVSYFLLVGLNK